MQDEPDNDRRGGGIGQQADDDHCCVDIAGQQEVECQHEKLKQEVGRVEGQMGLHRHSDVAMNGVVVAGPGQPGDDRRQNQNR